MMINLHQKHAVFAFDRQLLLAELIGELDWAYDVAAGRLSFGDRYQWQAEILGTAAEESDTWLWAWANERSDIPERQQRAALLLRTYGRKQIVPELMTPLVPLSQAGGHLLASIAVGERLGNAYYRAPYEGGAAFLLITDEGLEWQVDDPVQRIMSVFPQAISALELADHREAFRAYVQQYSLETKDSGSKLLVKHGGHDVLCADFDQHNRMRELTGTIGAQS